MLTALIWTFGSSNGAFEPGKKAQILHQNRDEVLELCDCQANKGFEMPIVLL
ncbi:MAG: hypothetical protein QGG54_21265 [Gammaproteobacteria bacterium]|nr:hypothetical protein [Gammaproteobacteria bacterium]